MSSPRLAMVACSSPLNPQGWSGTPYFLLRELRRRFSDITVIDTPMFDAVIARTKGLRRLGVLPEREPMVCVRYSRWLNLRLERLKPDAVIAVAAEAKVAGLAGNWPLVIISDSFFGNMVHYYDKYAALSRRTLDNGDAQQMRLLERGASVLLSSEWAARTAADYYGAERSRFQVAPFGANLEVDPPPTLPRPNAGPLKLLFIGYDWARKGGPMVLSIFQALRQRLGAVELHIVGCDPRDARGMEGVIPHGVLRKDVPAEADRLAALFRRSSFMIMPSRQEAYGLVYAEACAFGLPPVALDTGGVGSIIEHGVNGLLLPPGAAAHAFAQAVLGVWADPAAYLALQRGARIAFETRLNWRAWGDGAQAVIEAAAHAHPVGQAPTRADRHSARLAAG